MASSRSSVEQDAQARRELIQAQTDIQSQFHEERTGLDTRRQELHAEQKAVAAAAIREPVIAQTILVVGLVLATLLPLLVTAYALRRLLDLGPGDKSVAETLIESLDAELHLSLPILMRRVARNPPDIQVDRARGRRRNLTHQRGERSIHNLVIVTQNLLERVTTLEQQAGKQAA